MTLGSVITRIDGVDLGSQQFSDIVPAIRVVRRPLRLELRRPRFKYIPRSPAYGSPCVRLWKGRVRVCRHGSDAPLERTGAVALESVFLSSGGSVRSHVLAFLHSHDEGAEDRSVVAFGDDEPAQCFGLQLESEARPVAGHVSCIQVPCTQPAVWMCGLQC